MANPPICHLIWLVDPAFVAPTWHTPGVSVLLSLHFGRNHIDPILQFYASINISIDGYSLFVTNLRQKLVRKTTSCKDWWCVSADVHRRFTSASTYSRISIKFVTHYFVIRSLSCLINADLSLRWEIFLAEKLGPASFLVVWHASECVDSFPLIPSSEGTHWDKNWVYDLPSIFSSPRICTNMYWPLRFWERG